MDDRTELRREIGEALCYAYGDPDAGADDYEWIVSTVLAAIEDAGYEIVQP